MSDSPTKEGILGMILSWLCVIMGQWLQDIAYFFAFLVSVSTLIITHDKIASQTKTLYRKIKRLIKKK